MNFKMIQFSIGFVSHIFRLSIKKKNSENILKNIRKNDYSIQPTTITLLLHRELVPGSFIEL